MTTAVTGVKCFSFSETSACSVQIRKAAQLDSKVHGVWAERQTTSLPSLTQFWKMFIASGEFVEVSTPGQLGCPSCLIFPCPVTSQVIASSFLLFLSGSFLCSNFFWTITFHSRERLTKTWEINKSYKAQEVSNSQVSGGSWKLQDSQSPCPVLDKQWQLLRNEAFQLIELPPHLSESSLGSPKDVAFVSHHSCWVGFWWYLWTAA